MVSIDTSSHNFLPDFYTLEISYVSVALAVLGFYLVTIGQLSYLLKARLLMSSALIALCLGIGASLELSHGRRRPY